MCEVAFEDTNLAAVSALPTTTTIARPLLLKVWSKLPASGRLLKLQSLKLSQNRHVTRFPGDSLCTFQFDPLLKTGKSIGPGEYCALLAFCSQTLSIKATVARSLSKSGTCTAVLYISTEKAT